jgi:hypothetical protein
MMHSCKGDWDWAAAWTALRQAWMKQRLGQPINPTLCMCMNSTLQTTIPNPTIVTVTNPRCRAVPSVSTNSRLTKLGNCQCQAPIQYTPLHQCNLPTSIRFVKRSSSSQRSQAGPDRLGPKITRWSFLAAAVRERRQHISGTSPAL